MTGNCIGIPTVICSFFTALGHANGKRPVLILVGKTAIPMLNLNCSGQYQRYPFRPVLIQHISDSTAIQPEAVEVFGDGFFYGLFAVNVLCMRACEYHRSRHLCQG